MDLLLQVTEKTFQEMYINVGMANCEERPKHEQDGIRFTRVHDFFKKLMKTMDYSSYFFQNMDENHEL